MSNTVSRATDNYGRSAGDVWGFFFGKDDPTPPPPPPPPPPPASPPKLQQPKKPQMDRSKAGFAGTIATGAQGLQSAALTGGKTLLGQ